MINPIPVRLKFARKAAGYTQQQLGIILGMEPNTASARMNQYEKGKHTPDYLTMKRIAEVLGVPIVYFYCDDDLMTELICVVDKLDSATKKVLLSQLSGELEAGDC